MSTPSPWNQGALFSATELGEPSSRWATPRHVFEHFDREFRFDLDAAGEKRTRKVARYIGPDHPDPRFRDSFSVRWHRAYDGAVSTVFLNPPYGRGVGRWLDLAMHEARHGLTVAVLILARTDTQWFHDIVMPEASEVRLLRGRIRFVDPDTGVAGDACPAPSALVVFTPAGGPARFSSVTVPRPPTGPPLAELDLHEPVQWVKPWTVPAGLVS